jgi:hypothetical protein
MIGNTSKFLEAELEDDFEWAIWAAWQAGLEIRCRMCGGGH